MRTTRKPARSSMRSSVDGSYITTWRGGSSAYQSRLNRRWPSDRQFGTTIPIRAPGRTTRKHLPSRTPGSSTCSSTWFMVTTSKEPDGYSSSSSARSIRAPVVCLAIAALSESGSMPATRQPRSRMTASRRPFPQPTSRSAPLGRAGGMSRWPAAARIRMFGTASASRVRGRGRTARVARSYPSEARSALRTSRAGDHRCSKVSSRGPRCCEYSLG